MKYLLLPQMFFIQPGKIELGLQKEINLLLGRGLDLLQLILQLILLPQAMPNSKVKYVQGEAVKKLV